MEDGACITKNLINLPEKIQTFVTRYEKNRIYIFKLVKNKFSMWQFTWCLFFLKAISQSLIELNITEKWGFQLLSTYRRKKGNFKSGTSELIFHLKFMFSKKATKIDEIFTINLTLCSKCQIDSEDFVNFCGLLRKHELYPKLILHNQIHPNAQRTCPNFFSFVNRRALLSRLGVARDWFSHGLRTHDE